jgi:hypothetical protein
LRRYARRRSLGSIVLFALAAQLTGACAPASAQPSTGRAVAPVIFGGAAGDAGRPGLTVESASREAQAAIKACDDRAPFLCVADALTNYAAALQEIAEERRARSRAPWRKPQ